MRSGLNPWVRARKLGISMACAASGRRVGRAHANESVDCYSGSSHGTARTGSRANRRFGSFVRVEVRSDSDLDGSTVITRFLATTDALTTASQVRGLWARSALQHGRVSLVSSLGLPTIPSPTIGATTGDRPAASGFAPAPTGFVTHSQTRPGDQPRFTSSKRVSRRVCPACLSSRSDSCRYCLAVCRSPSMLD